MPEGELLSGWADIEISLAVITKIILREESQRAVG
jgi:hypothetical protein